MRLKELREEKELTQKEVGDGIQTSQRNIGRWEKDEVLPSSDFIIKLADFFGVSADYLLGRSDDFGNVSLSPTAPALSAEEQQLLALFGKMTHSQKVRVIAYSEGLLSTNSGSKFSKSQV